MISEYIIDMLKLLSLDSAGIWEFVPATARSLEYENLESDSDEIELIGVAIAVAAKSTLRRCCAFDWDATDDEEFWRMSYEMSCLLEMMLDLTQGASYHFVIGDLPGRVQGPYDAGWSILRRLALMALRIAGVEPSPPAQPFLELLRHGDVRPRVTSVD